MSDSYSWNTIDDNLNKNQLITQQWGMFYKIISHSWFISLQKKLVLYSIDDTSSIRSIFSSRFIRSLIFMNLYLLHLDIWSLTYDFLLLVISSIRITVLNIYLRGFVNTYLSFSPKSSIFAQILPKVVYSTLQLVILHICVPTETL